MRQNRVSVRRPFGLVCHFGLVPPAFPQPQTPPAGARGGPGPTTYTSHIKKNALRRRTRVNECGITDNERSRSQSFSQCVLLDVTCVYVVGPGPPRPPRRVESVVAGRPEVPTQSDRPTKKVVSLRHDSVSLRRKTVSVRPENPTQ